MLKVLFKKPSNIITKLIPKVTGGRYSHCEIVFWNTAFTAGPQGVYSVEITEDYLSQFDVLDVTSCIKKYNLQVMLGYEFVQTQLGKKYDWLNMFFCHFLPFDANKKNRWICSELVTATLQKCRLPITNEAKEVNPVKLYRILSRWFIQ